VRSLPLPDLVELSLNPENWFSGTNASKLIAGHSLTFVGHWMQGSSSVLPSGQEQVSNWTFKNQQKGHF
jgi:hypothetical protein